MIMLSTLRKLAAQNATVYQVNSPAFRVTVPGLERDMPAHVEVFATKAQAIHAASTSSAVCFGAPHAPTVTAIAAHMIAQNDALFGALFGTCA